MVPEGLRVRCCQAYTEGEIGKRMEGDLRGFCVRGNGRHAAGGKSVLCGILARFSPHLPLFTLQRSPRSKDFPLARKMLRISANALPGLLYAIRRQKMPLFGNICLVFLAYRQKTPFCFCVVFHGFMTWHERCCAFCLCKLLFFGVPDGWHATCYRGKR